jgi:hypothetical protein
MNPNFQVYAKILKFALIYRNGEGTGIVLTTAMLVLFLYTCQDQPYLSHKFVLQNNDLECVSRYKYLGIWFNNSGSFNFEEIYRTSSATFHNVV